MNKYQIIYLVISRKDDSRILAIFDNEEAAIDYGQQENGFVYSRMLRSKVPDQSSRYKGYIT